MVMTSVRTSPEPTMTDGATPDAHRKGNIFVSWLTTTDHKTIGYLYLITSFVYFCIAGVMALIMRAQLFAPGLTVVPTREQYNQLFTIHGTIMLLLFATPLFAGFTNVIMPLQIGAPDVAFPRLNAIAYWLYGFGAFMVVAGFLTPQEQRTSDGSPINRWRAARSRQVWEATCGCSGWR